MSNVTINNGLVMLDIANLSTNRLILAGVVIARQGSGQIPANQILGIKDRVEELLALSNAGIIQVSYNGTVLKADALTKLDAVTGLVDVFTDLTRPAAADVTDGTPIFNTDDAFQNVAEGGLWYDPTGAPT